MIGLIYDVKEKSGPVRKTIIIPAIIHIREEENEEDGEDIEGVEVEKESIVWQL